MRAGSVVLCALAPHPLLLVALAWLLAATLPVCAQLDAAEPLEKVAESRSFPGFTRVMSAKDVKQAVKKAPEKLRLGKDNFLNSGLRRKTIAGVYGTTAGVTLGAAAITYQTLNLRSKNRDAETKAQSESSLPSLSRRTATGCGIMC